MSDRVINEFIALTGCTQDRAKFYVEAAGGDLQLAIESYFETGGETGDDNEPIPIEEEPRVATSITSRHQAEPPVVESKQKTQKNESNKKIFSFSNFGGDGDSDEDEEQGQAFYAGGSEHSGQQILGPPRQKNPDEIVTNLFKKAKEHGAVEVNPSEEDKNASTKPGYYSSGYRLGDGKTPSEVIAAPSKPKEAKVRQLKLWKNGFTVDDGALRAYDDPANRDFIMSIQRGEPPRELLREADGAEVHVDMQDHRSEDYEEPKKPYKLFNNEGYKLGSPTPKVTSNASPNDIAKNEELAKQRLAMDSNRPSTQVQIRLSDGSRLIIKCNQTHKIKELRSYINTARPEYSTVQYALMTSFPNKEINNENESLNDAKLLNSVLIQKLK